MAGATASPVVALAIVLNINKYFVWRFVATIRDLRRKPDTDDKVNKINNLWRVVRRGAYGVIVDWAGFLAAGAGTVISMFALSWHNNATPPIVVIVLLIFAGAMLPVSALCASGLRGAVRDANLKMRDLE